MKRFRHACKLSWDIRLEPILGAMIKRNKRLMQGIPYAGQSLYYCWIIVPGKHGPQWGMYKQAKIIGIGRSWLMSRQWFRRQYMEAILDRQFSVEA